MAGFLRAPLHSVRPHFGISFAGCSGGFCFWRKEVSKGGGERSHMALVLFLHSFSRLTAKAPRTRSRIKARSAFERGFISPVCLLWARSALAPDPFSRPVPFSYGGPQVMSLSLFSREEWVRICLPPPGRLAGTPPVSPIARLAIGGGRRGGQVARERERRIDLCVLGASA